MEDLQPGESLAILYTQTITKKDAEKEGIVEFDSVLYTGKSYGAFIGRRSLSGSPLKLIPDKTKKREKIRNLEEVIEFMQTSLVKMQKERIKVLTLDKNIPNKIYLIALTGLMPPYGEIESLNPQEYKKVKENLKSAEGLEIKYLPQG